MFVLTVTFTKSTKLSASRKQKKHERMSEFARRQLEKYGWTEGKGLGKAENGITEALKPILKFDTQGIGHDGSKIWTSRWWCDIFNDASKQINVVNSKFGVHISSHERKLHPVLPSPTILQGKFIKAADQQDIPPCVLEDSNFVTNHHKNENIYKKCESTKKKYFNYSLMKGKLKRIEKQETMYIQTGITHKMKDYNCNTFSKHSKCSREKDKKTSKKRKCIS